MSSFGVFAYLNFSFLLKRRIGKIKLTVIFFIKGQGNESINLIDVFTNMLYGCLFMVV